MRYAINIMLQILLMLIATTMIVACDTSQPVQLKEGEVFPIDELKQLTAVDASPVNYNNKTLVINFWASWCSPCRKEMPDLQRLSDSLNSTMEKNQFVVIGISVDEDLNLMKEFLLKNNIRFPNYQDKNKRLSQTLLGIRAYPETFIVSPQGIIIKRILGEQRWNNKSIHELLNAIHTGKKHPGIGWVFG